MAKVLGRQHIGVPVQITMSEKLTLLGKLGVAIVKLGTFLLMVSAIQIQSAVQIQEDEESKKKEAKETLAA